MAETTLDSTASRRFDFSRVSAVLLHPHRGFERIVALSGPGWQMPMLVLSLTTLLGILVSGYLKARAALMGTAPLPLDFQYWTPDMQQNYYQAQQAMQGPVFVYVIPLVGALISLWFGWFVLGGLIHFTSTLLGGRGSFVAALTITAFALLPFAVRDILRIIFMLLSRQPISSPGLSGFATGAGFWAQLLARVDLFLLWHILLLILGFALADGLPKNKALGGVLAVMLLLLLMQAGLGALGAGLGGLAVQRPFF